jgi:hypothetical protein
MVAVMCISNVCFVCTLIYSLKVKVLYFPTINPVKGHWFESHPCNFFKTFLIMVFISIFSDINAIINIAYFISYHILKKKIYN